MKFLLALSLAFVATNANQSEQPTIVKENEPTAISQTINSIGNKIENKQNIIGLKPLPLIMPTFKIDQEGKVSITNVFDVIKSGNQELIEYAENKDKKQIKVQKEMIKEHKKDGLYLKIELESTIGGKKGKHLKYEMRRSDQLIGGGEHDAWIADNMPLIGGGDHDFNIAQNMPLIGGGDHDFNIEQDINQNAPFIGGDGHDQWEQDIIKQNMPLIGGDGHDNRNIQIQHPMVGGDDHDNWEDKRPLIGGGDHDQIGQMPHPMVGGDGHDNWMQKRRQFENNQPLIGGDGHDEWKKKCNKMNKKGNRKHSNFDKKHWQQNKQFTSEQIKPYLMTKLPDFKENSQIISIVNNGWKKKLGFNLIVQIVNEKKENMQISAFFKPRNQEFLIEKIEAVKEVPFSLIHEVLNAADNLKKSQELIVPPIAIDPQPIVMVEENFMSTEQQKIVDEVVKSLISEVKEQKQPQATFEDVEEKKDEPITLSLEQKTVDIKRNLQSNFI